MHLLEWFRAIPVEGGPQDAVSGDHPLPGRAQALGLDRFTQGENELLDVHATVRLSQGMEEHALL